MLFLLSCSSKPKTLISDQNQQVFLFLVVVVCFVLPFRFFLIQSVSSVAQSCPTFCDPMHCSTPGFPVHPQLLELAQIRVHRVGDATQPSHPLLSPSPPAFNLAQHLSQVFPNESVLCIRWPKYWSFSFRIRPSNEYSGLTFFRMDWFDPPAVQGTLESLLQHHSLKLSVLQYLGVGSDFVTSVACIHKLVATSH